MKLMFAKNMSLREKGNKKYTLSTDDARRNGNEGKFNGVFGKYMLGIARIDLGVWRSGNA